MKHVKYPYDIDPTGLGFFWPASDQKRSEWLSIKRLQPIIAEAVYQCNPGARQGIIFSDDDLAYYQAPDGLDIGMASPQVASFVREGAFIVQSWDTAFSAEKDSDYTVCVTALLTSSVDYHRGEDPKLLGPCEQHYRVDVLDVFRGKVDWGDLTAMARALYLKWHPQTVLIEKRAYGVSLISNLQTIGMPIEPVEPVAGKRSRVIDGLGAGSVQGWFRLHRVRYPAGVSWLDDYWTEMKDFTGVKGGQDDQVDATAHLVGWAIRAGGSGGQMPTGWGDPAAVYAMMAGGDTDFSALSRNDAPALMPGMIDPFDGCCGRCRSFDTKRHWCGKFERPAIAIGGCEEYAGVDGNDYSLAANH